MTSEVSFAYRFFDDRCDAIRQFSIALVNRNQRTIRIVHENIRFGNANSWQRCSVDNIDDIAVRYLLQVTGQEKGIGNIRCVREP